MLPWIYLLEVLRKNGHQLAETRVQEVRWHFTNRGRILIKGQTLHARGEGEDH